MITESRNFCYTGFPLISVRFWNFKDGAKRQDFWQRINILKGICFKQKSVDELRFVKKCENFTFKVNFRCQKSTKFVHKNH